MTSLARLWPLHLFVLVVGVLSQWIGVRSIPIWIGTIMLLPMLFAFAMTLVLNPNVIGAMSKILSTKKAAAAAPFIVIAIMPFIAKFGTTIGPAIEEIIAAGPALILQELGNLGTILFAFPVAIWLLRMRRESIGAVHSIAREPNLAIIADRYGIRSPEGTGVMGVYVMGTLFGTFLFAIFASVLASLDVFRIEALAMACGVGSGSMMAACAGALAETVPQSADTITAMAGASNLLTYATGMYVSLFVALPLVEWLYSKVHPNDPGHRIDKEEVSR
ncbi:MAG: DUF3100 domain-containing protein [Brachybacterium sp.]|nr:DUF3100 domain-containing protein [Brachybacterium sp.]